MPSPSHQAQIEIAVKHHRSGNLPEAEKIYRAVLQADPRHPVALNLLGLIASQMGQHAAGIELIEKSIAAEPNNIDALINLGNIHIELEHYHEAIACFNKAISLNPNSAAVHANLSVPLRLLERYEEADISARKAIKIDPNLVEAHNSLGIALHEQEKWKEAIETFETGLSLNPNHQSILNNLGNVYKSMEQMDKAVATYKKVLSLAPDHVDALNNLGTVYQELGDLDEAAVLLRKALKNNPNFAEAHCHLGITLQKQGKRTEAIDCYKKALAAKPNYVDAVFNLSFSLLLEGNLKEGLDYYEWRWKDSKMKSGWRPFPAPVWDGSDLRGKRILVWGEQGIGDEIVYASLYPELLSRGAECLFECEERLVPLFQRSFPKAIVVSRTSPPNAQLLNNSIDFQCPAASLMKWLLPSFDTGPDREDYLVANQEKTENLETKYRHASNDKVVGLAWWTQNSKLKHSYNIPIEHFDHLIKTPGVRFVNLQYGDQSAQIEATYDRTGVRILQDENIDPLQNMDDYAAFVASMDLVISIVNSTAVLGSGLGVPVWGILPAHTEWRWGNETDRCLWYPSMRLFRQNTRGSWGTVETEIADAFKIWVAETE